MNLLATTGSELNQIRIGIIGPRQIVGQILRVVDSFPSFAAVPLIYRHEDDAPKLAERISGDVEVILFSDPLSHRKAKESLRVPVLMHHVPLTDAGLYKALFHAQQDGLLAEGISVDSLTDKMVRRTLKDLGKTAIRPVIYDGPAYAPRDKLVAFHREQFEAGACTVAFTGMESVSRELTELGIPNRWLVPADQDIVVSLERALLSTETRRSKEGQIVVGMINIDDFGKLALTCSNEHEVQKLKLDIHRMVLDYVEALDGYLTHLGGDEYLFFTTRGIFERESGGYKTIPLAKDMNKTHGISLSIGIGFGRSASVAGTNARIAMRKAKEAGGNACFIVREDGTLIGPLEMAEPVREVLSFTDAELIKRAEDAGMTSAYLSKLLHNGAKYGKYEYQVHELAALLGITVRSAHRLLLHWIDHGLVEVTGFEKVPRGRPRQIFTFTLLLNRQV
ncbi:hypothetical protein ABEV74_08755 [Paenibacillus cisolokensis]|jgi:Uncharacterized conserved protein|uniref:hypothetical protein n=1 Tax=Paenibacillus TaxID=44249 RepID=UPI00071EFA6E|nr:hypothetical protein [Paenibacillus sp. 32O-W]ALS25681.1 GGDEF domain-containing protein [Paenibacillus sp. 32O-W]